ncbi:MAG: hypothetical protein RLZZ362_365 [Actinomycetota bacterium]|jgi:hypothetical protein
MSKDLGEFIDPLGLLTRQWIVAGLDTDASLVWLLARSGEHGWNLTGPQRLRKGGAVLEVRATVYLHGIGFDNMHNLRMTRAEPPADLEVVQAHGSARPHGHRVRRPVCSLRA